MGMCHSIIVKAICEDGGLAVFAGVNGREKKTFCVSWSSKTYLST